jgi:hypothetical protein
MVSGELVSGGTDVGVNDLLRPIIWV